MFFIHYNDAYVIKGRKYGRSGPYNHINLVHIYFSPLIQALALSQRRVDNCYTLTKSCPKTPFCLRDERNFRHKYNGCSFFFDNILNQVHIDLGFSRTCNSGEKIDLKLICRPAFNLINNGFLFGCQLRWGIRVNRLSKRVSENPAGDNFKQPLFFHCFY